MAMLLACNGGTHFGFHLENRAISTEVCHDFPYCLQVGSGQLSVFMFIKHGNTLKSFDAE
jgi:hypothetical protein